MSRVIGIVGVFAHLDDLLEAIRHLRAGGFEELRALSPVPLQEIDEALGRRESPVRVFTLVGGILGGVTGLFLTINTSIGYPLIVGGKPIVAIPAFIVITFELTILFGALGTVLGLLTNARVPRLRLGPAFDPRFCSDRFGLFVRCQPGEVETVSRLLLGAGAEEIRHVEA